MKKCSNCEAANLDKAKFCHQCGALMDLGREIPSTVSPAANSQRPSLEDLEFVQTDLTTENPRTLKMKDKVSLNEGASDTLAKTSDYPSEAFIDATPHPRQSADKDISRADTGEVYMADTLANISSEIDLDADITNWQAAKKDKPLAQDVEPNVEPAPRKRASSWVAVEGKPPSAEAPTSVTPAVDETSQAATTNETDLISPAQPQHEPDQTAKAAADVTSAVGSREGRSAKKSAEHPDVSSTTTDGKGVSYHDNPIFKREPVYIAPETFGPSEREARRGLDVELAAVVSTIDCPNCGHKNPDYYSFCQNCKHRLYDYQFISEAEATAPIAGTSTNVTNSSGVSGDRPEQTDLDDEVFVPAYIEVDPVMQDTTQKHSSKKNKKKKEHSSGGSWFGWIVTILIILIIAAAAFLGYQYLFGGPSASAVYQSYSEAILSQNYAEAANLTANTNGYAWTADDVEGMVTNYAEAQIDLPALLSANPDATELSHEGRLLLEVDTEPSFLGLFPQYQLYVQPLTVALSVPNDYRDIAITTLSHAAQPITAGDPIVIEPREDFIIISISENGEAREIGIDLDYSKLSGSALSISLKQVENRLMLATDNLGLAYPQEMKATSFTIDGQTYNADIITLNGYVGQSFTVSVQGEYLGQAFTSADQQVNLVDGQDVQVSLAEDTALLTELTEIEASQGASIASRTPVESAEIWLQSFQNTFIDAVNFRAPEMLSRYGTDSEWYNTTATWILNDVASNSIYYNTATYEILSAEVNESGQLVLLTTEEYTYTLAGVEAISAQSRVYVLTEDGGQYTIVSVESQEIAN